MKPACGPRSNMGYRLPRCGLLRGVAAHMNGDHGIASASQNFGAHGLQMQHDKKDRKCQRHDEERPKKRRSDGRAVSSDDARRLVQRVPPVHRILDDRNIDGSDDGQNCGGPSGAPRFIDRLPQGDQPEIEEEQDKDGCQPRVPNPVSAPHRLAPERSRHKRKQA